MVEKNVVIMIRPPLDQSTALGKSEKQIERQNKHIERQNKNLVAEVKSDLENYYNHGTGSTNTNGDKVEFVFNIKTINDFDKKGMSKDDVQRKYDKISMENGIEGVKNGTNITAGAFVFTRAGAAGFAYGDADGNIGRLNANRISGIISHEVVHGFRVADDDRRSGGVRDNTPEPVLPSEVDLILNECYEKKKN